MRNMKSIISAHNHSILNPPKTNYGCNCRDNVNRPLKNQSLHQTLFTKQMLPTM